MLWPSRTLSPRAAAAGPVVPGSAWLIGALQAPTPSATLRSSVPYPTGAARLPAARAEDHYAKWFDAMWESGHAPPYCRQTGGAWQRLSAPIPPMCPHSTHGDNSHQRLQRVKAEGPIQNILSRLLMSLRFSFVIETGLVNKKPAHARSSVLNVRYPHARSSHRRASRRRSRAF